ncbi:MAG: VanZ family protein [Candidatus Omnitrophica bacterium]|nr:VanZ family protein [Candidatus Omnitrophota bacterium]
MGLIIREPYVLIRRWRLFFAYVAFIYISLPFAPGIWERLIANFGNRVESSLFVIVVLAGTLIIFKFLSLRRQQTLVGILIICVVFSLFLVILRSLKLPAERIHLFEYVILPLFIYRSLKKEQKISTIYVKIFVIGFIAGFIDEVIQYMLPNRVFDVKDILLNGNGVLLGQGLLYCFKHLS